jgi:general secretion pathway protein D
MKKRLAPVLLLVLALALPAAADKAKSAYDKGRDAEARQNWEQAYEFYKQAYDLKPKDLRYRAAFTRSRFEAASVHVHRGQILRDNGNLEQALAEFQRAAEIDPSLDIADQEIQRTREMIQKAGTAPPKPGPPPASELGRIASEARGPAELKPIENKPITLRMTEDSKKVYTTLGALAGINVLFDPDYVSRRITVDLNNVTLMQALEIVALESKTFWRAVTSNTIFVAADTKAKRTELEQNVVKTFYLSNAYTTTDIQDAVNTLRTVAEITRVVPLTAQSALVVRGTPDQVALAEKILNDIDKARPEVLVEVAVMQVTRNKMRDLGIQPPQSGTVQLQQNVQTTTGTSGAAGTTTTSPITLNKLANLTSNDFTVTIPSASAQFLFSDSDTKIIQNPQIRALNQQKATLKIGDRVPVATGSFQPGIGGVGINPLVNTQFQYIDVGVNIDITPTVHLNREISLKVAMEVSSVTSHVNIGGIDQPVIGQRRIEHEIRLKEGEVNLIGGIMEQDDVRSLSGWPWLSQIPILKYLFSQETHQKTDNEIVFALIPHIVRGQEISELNQRPLDIGTANAIELRRGDGMAPASTAAPAAQPAAARPAQQPGAAPAQAMPGTQQPAPATPAPAVTPPGAQPAQPQGSLGTGAAILSFDPPQVTQAAGSTFAVNVSVSGARNLYSVPVQISYDPKLLKLLNVSNGPFLSQDGQPVALVHREDENTGSVQVSATRPPGASGVSGQGVVFTLTFLAKSAGQSTLNITRAGARDPAMQPVQVTTGQAMVAIK